MAVFDALVEAYVAEGFEVAAGQNPTLLDDFFLAPFTWLVQDGRSVTDGLGISPLEIYLLEALAQARPARRVLVIGNSFGWSTLALALANPGAQVIAIDAGYDENSLKGIDLTNAMAARLGLNVRVVEAVSPQDVPDVVRSTVGELDLVFVDGFHSSEQIIADWYAVRPFLAPDAVVLLHDVLFVALEEGYRHIVEESGWTGQILHATTTGMGLLVRKSDAALTRLVTAFGGHPNALAVVRAAAAKQAHLRGTAQRAAALREVEQVARRAKSPVSEREQR